MRGFFSLLTFFLFSWHLAAQHTISGTFSPEDKFKWLLVYYLKPAGQTYIADTAVENGSFELKMPENTPPGTYRMVYAVPQSEFYFDVLYSGEEDIVLHFDLEQGVSFKSSKENTLFLSYFNEINRKEQRLAEYYDGDSLDPDTFKGITKDLDSTQKSFEQRSKGLLVHKFITANAPFIPKEAISKYEYAQRKKERYFQNLNLGDQDLQASDFLTEKAMGFVFTALPAKVDASTTLESILKNNVNTLSEAITVLSEDFQFYLFYRVWEQTNANRLYEASDFLLNTHMRPKARSVDEKKIMDFIDGKNKLRLGAVAPEIEWDEGSTTKKLSTLEDDAHNYLLVFWSSNCGHCLKELPELHEMLKTKPNVSVIAIGLEDDELNWKKEILKFTRFRHVLSLGKWESTYAMIYDVQTTPTYYWLDKDKKIIAKPKDKNGVEELLKDNGVP